MSQPLPLLAKPPRDSALPDVTTALAWRDWPAGLDEAALRRLPMLVLAEPAWTNSAQRLGLILARDDGVRQTLTERIVPVRIDPFARPDLAARLRRAAIALTGTSGPPLLMILTHEGLPFLSAGNMWPEGSPSYPSLASMAQATADAYANDTGAFLQEARDLEERATRPVAPRYRSARELWQALATDVDDTHGGLQESPKHPHPNLLWLLLELGETDGAPDARDHVRTTLNRMIRGGINDQIGEGFYRCARDERWIVPHFEQPLPLNARLAALYAKAARVYDDENFLAVATDLIAFCEAGLGDGVDAVGADSFYATWTSRELLASLDSELVQAVSLHFNLTPDGSRQVLYQARDPEAMARTSGESATTLARRLVDGRRQLRAARQQRPFPALVRLPGPSWRAQTLRWLFSVAEHGGNVATDTLVHHLDRLTVGQFQDGVGYPRPAASEKGPAAWLEDQAAILAAMLAAARTTGADRWREPARQLADLLLAEYRADGWWLDQPRVTGAPQRSRAVTDEPLPSAIATVTESLVELARLTGDHRYQDAAYHGAARHLPNDLAAAHWAAALWRAWFNVCQDRS